jgi:geranylgeranyl diphosphate synthase type II
MNTFLDVLSQYRDILWPHIEKNITNSLKYPRYCSVNKKFQPEIDFHRQLILEYPQRKGKYFRPSLLLLTAQSMGISIKKALNTAAAMQISEDWILNHDDIEDNSPDRRGKPTLHKMFGLELALNAGDALHLIMWQTLFKNFSTLGNQKSIEILDEFQTMLNRTVLGQGVELKWAVDHRYDLGDEDNFFVLESKTGYYTIAGPMRLGAILADANQSQLDSLYRFGVLLGRSYQIVDDLLDLTSDFSGLKKIKGNDILESKKTIMLLHLYRTASAIDRKITQDILDKSRDQKQPKDIQTVITLMEKYGSINYGQKLAKKFAEESTTIFEKELSFIKLQPFRDQIKSGIDFIVNRDH